MLAHSSQMLAGMTPRRMRNAKMMQPRHRPMKASSEAATTSNTMSVQPGSEPPVSSSTKAAMDSDGADPLGESLGRAWDQFRFAHERGQNLDGEQCRRGDARAEGQAQHKAAAMMPTSHGNCPTTRDKCQHHNDAGREPGGVLVDRVGKRKDPLQRHPAVEPG